MRDAVPQAEVCVCLRACVCARAVCAARSKTDKQSTLCSSDASKRSNTHKACKNGRLGEYSPKHSLCLKVNENSWEKIVCQYFVLVTDWCFINRALECDLISHATNKNPRAHWCVQPFEKRKKSIRDSETQQKTPLLGLYRGLNQSEIVKGGPPL